MRATPGGPPVSARTEAQGSAPDLVALAREHGMQAVGRRPRLTDYLRQVARRRYFVLALARSGIRSATARDRLGPVWLVLTPLLQGAVYAAIFGFLLQTSRGVDNFLGYLLVGVFLFQYTAKSLSDGSKAVTGNRKLIQVLSFPRAALPLSTTLRNTLQLVPAFGVALALVLLAPGEEVVSWRWVLLVPVLVLMTLFNLGLSFVAAWAAARVNDVQQVIPFLLRIWFYTSGIFFAFDRFTGGREWLEAVLTLNPMHVFLTLARDAFLYGQDSPASFWWQAAAWSVGVTVLGFVLFWRDEETYSHD